MLPGNLKRLQEVSAAGEPITTNKQMNEKYNEENTSRMQPQLIC